MRKALAVSFVFVVLGLMFAPALHAQGCAMCYTTAAGQDPAAARKLDFAILALLIPVLVLFVSVLGLAIHRRNAETQDSTSESFFAMQEEPRPAARLQLELPPHSAD